jgi:putative addiction module killer protein
MRVKRTEEFEDWFESLTVKDQAQIDARLHRIEEHEYFGDAKDLGDGLAELRWTNGRRVYFTRAVDDHGRLVLVLLGGLKNAQKKDIKQARLLVRKYAGD